MSAVIEPLLVTVEDMKIEPPAPPPPPPIPHPLPLDPFGLLFVPLPASSPSEEIVPELTTEAAEMKIIPPPFPPFPGK